MIKGRNSEENQVIKGVIESGNEHVFHFWDELADNEKDNLLKQLKSIDFQLIAEYYNNYKNIDEKSFDKFEPVKYLSAEESISNNELNKIGADALKSGEIAFLTVAGGQGSRLGYEHPKGCFPISPVKKKPLFQIFAEKILFYSSYYSNNFFWYIMTSKYNYRETLDFFIANDFFGLNKNNVIFFKQGTFPSLTIDGKLILADKSNIFMNPDGHGGILKALLKNNLLEDIKIKGIKHLSYFQVDNPLVDMADPRFIGYHIREKSNVTTKVIAKLYPEEKLGVIGRINGKSSVIEYSDLPEKEMFAVDENGKLLYLMGSIAVHIFEVDFLMNFTEKMPLHYAEKKIKGYFFNDNDKPIFTDMNGTKFETFIFDTIPLAERALFFETDREVEFYPVKNKDGFDSIDTCIIGQSRLFYSWLKDAGLINEEYNNQMVEISPLYSPVKEIFLEKVNENSDKFKNDNLKNQKEIYIE